MVARSLEMLFRVVVMSVAVRSLTLRRTPLRPVSVTGRDAQSFLHAMLSADVASLVDGSSVESCLLSGSSLDVPQGASESATEVAPACNATRTRAGAGSGVGRPVVPEVQSEAAISSLPRQLPRAGS